MSDSSNTQGRTHMRALISGGEDRLQNLMERYEVAVDCIAQLEMPDVPHKHPEQWAKIAYSLKRVAAMESEID
jgi:hypothetical protein